MTGPCPKAPADQRTNDQCGGSGIIPFDTKTGPADVPCGWCWTASGQPALTLRDVARLSAWWEAVKQSAGGHQLALDGLDHDQAAEQALRFCFAAGIDGVTVARWRAWMTEAAHA